MDSRWFPTNESNNQWSTSLVFLVNNQRGDFRIAEIKAIMIEYGQLDAML